MAFHKMLIKNQIYEAVITDYTSEGQGVAHIEGCAVFIPNAIAGEKVLVRIEKAQKTWASGKIVEILEKSPHRINRECPVAKLCGGCDLQHMDYEEETRLKSDRVRQCLNRIGGENLTEMPILSAPTCYGYRNKAQYPVSSHRNRVFAGFFKAGTHQVIENEKCLILPPETDRVKKIVTDYVNHYRISAYDETTGQGLLRHIFVRRGWLSGEILVCLTVNGKDLPKAKALIGELQKIPGFCTLVLSVNTKKGNTVLGDEFITLYGPGYITDTMCGLTFRLSARSFYQVNHHQAQRLYEAAIAQAEITKNDLVLDLYCGVGSITLAMAKAAGKGFEILTYEHHYPVFAGSRLPVKKLGWGAFYGGKFGMTVALTGDAAVNPNVPVAILPFAMCNQMCHRLSIYSESDAAFGAFLSEKSGVTVVQGK